MTHAWLIIAHNEWGILQRLVSELDAPECDFYVHIDKKVKDLPLLKVEKGRLIMLENRLDVRWGSVSQIECELTLFEAAAANGPYDFYHIISGVTLPLKPFEELDAWFAGHSGKNIFFGLCQSASYQETLKVRRYSFFLRGFMSRSTFRRKVSQFLWKGAIAIQRSLHIEANRGKTFYKAANWVSLTEDAVRYILSHKKRILKSYRYSFCGDEFFVPSELMSSPLKERVLSYEQYLLQKMGRATTEAFPLEEYESMKASGYLFARKFTEKSIAK